ncbi:hypothetical protein NA57DRAFT_70119 [Rhizodiscina lignyota]|uniref:Oxo-4-hydroxy-4-carboxy-5-ureidoimidazoline decarboxylase domain-containing protein n=1 Tax=Rhizodiscina lignyota TaxID=1504668 RepID=A0A9P4IPW3_9PEZI|nr:hypothetical protein NA57DRAFT_70119 [Rhizodiscina lignyota]
MSHSLERLPSISDLPTLPEATQNAVLDLLFEPSPAVHALARPIICSADDTATSPPLPLFSSYDDLIELIGVGMKTLAVSPREDDIEVLDGILGAHPRLGEKKVDSALSRMEQAAMNAASATAGAEDEEARRKEEEANMLKSLNEEYEATFPTLRYVVFVNGRPRPVIMDDMRARISRADIKAEREEAIKAMCEIASDRAKKLQ